MTLLTTVQKVLTETLNFFIDFGSGFPHFSNVGWDSERFVFEARNFTLGEIDEEHANELIKFIADVNAFDDLQELSFKKYERKPIRLHINSAGGNTYDGAGLVGAIETSKTKIHAIGLGSVMSSALDILVACHYRTAHKLTTFMYHGLSYSSDQEKKIHDHDKESAESKRIQAACDKLLVDRTKLTKKRLDEVKNKKEDWYFTAAEALKFGVIDKIV